MNETIVTDNYSESGGKRRWDDRRPHEIGAYGFYKLGMRHWFKPIPPGLWGPVIDGGNPLMTGPNIMDGWWVTTILLRFIDGGRP